MFLTWALCDVLRYSAFILLKKYCTRAVRRFPMGDQKYNFSTKSYQYRIKVDIYIYFSGLIR